MIRAGKEVVPKRFLYRMNVFELSEWHTKILIYVYLSGF